MQSQIQSLFSTSKWVQSPKLPRHPPKRWGHTGTIYRNKLYIYGGKTGRARQKQKQKQKQKQPIYELDYNINGKFPIRKIKPFMECCWGQDVHMGGMPERKGMRFDCHLKYNGIALNDCIGITVKQKTYFWNQVQQYPKIKERESHATTVVKDKYILLYGGSNQDTIYKDFWIFNTENETWTELIPSTKFNERLGSTLTCINNKVYLFGGQDENQRYHSDLFCLTLPQLPSQNPSQSLSSGLSPLSLKIDLLTPNSSRPNPRSSHSALAYLNRYLLILAGECPLSTNSQGKVVSTLLNDLWCYDTQGNKWERIQIENNGIFKPRSCFSAGIWKNKIVVFGGLISIQGFRSSDEIFFLELGDVREGNGRRQGDKGQKTEKGVGVCNLCNLHFRGEERTKIVMERQKEEILCRDYLEFGLNNLYKLSRKIKNPFDAICLIIEGFQKMKYSSVSIDLIESRILIVQASGKALSKQDFKQLKKYQFIEQFLPDDPRIRQSISPKIFQQNLQILSFNLKNGCSRLGNNFIIMNNRQKIIDLLLITPQNIFYVEYDFVLESVQERYRPAYHIVRNYIDRNNLNLSLLLPGTCTVAVTELTKVSASKSQMKVNGRGIIQIQIPYQSTRNSNNKNQNSQIEIQTPNLQSYCKELFLSKPNLTLVINGIQIEFTNLKAQYQQNNYESFIENDFMQIKLRERERDKSKDEHVNVYRNGVRVGKFWGKDGRQSGQNGNKWGKFVQGYVCVSNRYELNLLRYRLQNWRNIQQKIKKVCKQFLQTSNKRSTTLSMSQLQQIIHQQ